MKRSETSSVKHHVWMMIALLLFGQEIGQKKEYLAPPSRWSNQELSNRELPLVIHRYQLLNEAVVLTRLPPDEFEKARKCRVKRQEIVEKEEGVQLESRGGWAIEDSSLERVNRALSTDIIHEVMSFVKEHPDRIITVLDWGVGKGRTLNDIAGRLRKQGALSHVRLIGFGDIYYFEWELADPAIEFILDKEYYLGHYFFENEIDYIYSYLGLTHLGISLILFSGKYWPHLQLLYPLLRNHGKIVHEGEGEITGGLHLAIENKFKFKIIQWNKVIRLEKISYMEKGAFTNRIENCL